MTGVPGGDVTLHAAITAELTRHRVADGVCYCGWRWVFVGQSQTGAQEAAAHQAERIMAVLADRLPHTPADQLATLIGGTVHEQRPAPITGRPVRRWAIGPIHEVPDSPPETLRERVGRNLGSPVTDDEWDAYLAWVKAGRQRTAAPEPRQDT